MTRRPGQSGRTLWKHTLLDSVLGAEIGAFLHLGQGRRRYVMLDLCAGDGRPADASGKSSPGIMLAHRDWARARGLDVIVVLVERNGSAVTSLDELHPTADYVIHGDSRDPGVIPTLWGRDDFVFIHNDPNSIADFALSPDLIGRLPRFTTTLSTLGCNVGGLKRSTLEDRRGWYDHVDTVTSTMSRWHDELIIRVERDDSQWAYLLTRPIKWQEKAEAQVRRAFRDVPVETAWRSHAPADFYAICDVLFLTKQERSA